MQEERRCQTCFGTGEAASEHGIMDCPDGIAQRMRFVANRALNLYDVDQGGG